MVDYDTRNSSLKQLKIISSKVKIKIVADNRLS